MGMFFKDRPWIIGAMMSLESMRKSQSGTALMGAFIVSETGNLRGIQTQHNHLAILTEIGRTLVTALTVVQPWCAWAWLDYLDGVT